MDFRTRNCSGGFERSAKSIYNWAELGPIGLLVRPRRMRRLAEDEKSGFAIFSTKFQACDDQLAAANATDLNATEEKERRLGFSPGFKFSIFSAPFSTLGLFSSLGTCGALPLPFALPCPLSIVLCGLILKVRIKEHKNRKRKMDPNYTHFSHVLIP